MSEHERGIMRKSVYEKVEEDDGIRILTVRRLTQNDGITPTDIFDNTYDYWHKEIAAPSALVGAWYRGEINRDIFEKYYKLFLTLPKQRELLEDLRTLAQMTKVTVLCVCLLTAEDDYCHTLTLIDQCKIG